jgi:hypothetical protein
MISYYWSEVTMAFAICVRSTSANGNCDQQADWSNLALDGWGHVWSYTGITAGTDGDPMIAYHRGNGSTTWLALWTCDRSTSPSGKCLAWGDWSLTTVDEGAAMGQYASIAADANGDRMTAYYDGWTGDLKAAIRDDTGTWVVVVVESDEDVGQYTSIAVNSSGDPVISYYDATNQNLKFAVCDLSATDCDQTADWNKTAVDTDGDVGQYTSIAVNSSGDPVISYYDATNQNLKFAVCDLSATDCDQTADWNKTAVDADGDVGQYTSIAVNSSGDHMISYYDVTNTDLKFALCHALAGTHGSCGQGGDWTTETVDSGGDVGSYSDIAVDATRHPVISYYDRTNDGLKFAIGTLPTSVGGIAELPALDSDAAVAESGSSVPDPLALGALAAGGALLLVTGALYARRRWLR